jgi:hypothetical protein
MTSGVVCARLATKLLTTEDVAEMTGLSRETLAQWRWLKKEIPFVRLLIASDVLSHEELTALKSFWMWETLKSRWSYIADWEAAKREAVERVAEFTRVQLGELPFRRGSDVEEGNDCVDDRDEA